MGAGAGAGPGEAGGGGTLHLPPEGMHSTMVRALLECGRDLEALDFLEQACARGFSPGPRVLTVATRCCAALAPPGSAPEVVEAALARAAALVPEGVAPDAILLASRMTLAMQLGVPERALAMLPPRAEGEGGDAVAGLQAPLAVAAAACGRLEPEAARPIVGELVRRARELAAAPAGRGGLTVELGSALAYAYAKLGDTAGCLDVAELMLEAGVPLGEHCVGALIFALTREGLPGPALAVHEAAIDGGLQPSAFTRGTWARGLLIALLTSTRRSHNVVEDELGAEQAEGSAPDPRDSSAPGAAPASGEAGLPRRRTSLEGAYVLGPRVLQLAARMRVAAGGGGVGEAPPAGEASHRRASKAQASAKAPSYLVGEDEAAWARGGQFKGRLEDAGRVVRAFRAAISAGYEPSSVDIDMALECMRLRTLRRFTDAEYEGVPDAPFSSPGAEFSVLGSPGGPGGAAIPLGAAGAGFDAGFDAAPAAPAEQRPRASLSDGAGVFRPEAFSLLEEASSNNTVQLRIRQNDIEALVDLRAMNPVTAEVGLLVVMRALQRRWNSTQGTCHYKELQLLVPSWAPPLEDEDSAADLPARGDLGDASTAPAPGLEDGREGAEAAMSDWIDPSDSWAEPDEFPDGAAAQGSWDDHNLSHDDADDVYHHEEEYHDAADEGDGFDDGFHEEDEEAVVMGERAGHDEGGGAEEEGDPEPELPAWANDDVAAALGAEPYSADDGRPQTGKKVLDLVRHLGMDYKTRQVGHTTAILLLPHVLERFMVGEVEAAAQRARGHFSGVPAANGVEFGTGAPRTPPQAYGATPRAVSQPGDAGSPDWA